MQAGRTQTERDEARRRRGRFRRWWAARPASRLAVVGRATRVQTGRIWHRCRRSARRGWAALWQRLTPSGSADGPENSQQEANISLAFHAIWLVPALLGAAGVVLLFSLTLWPETTQHRSHQQPTTLSQVSISAVEPVPHDGDAGQPPDPFAPEPVRVIKDGVTPVEATPGGATDEMLKQTADLGSNERTPDVGAELAPTTALATSEPPSDLSEKDLPSPTPRGHQPIPDRLAHLPSPASTTEVTRRAPPLPDLDALPQ
ncbi:MAG: hypothetical protein GXP27_14525, partial [Planctomycetes bacterium]|nr:hypothetical protein [Planctomycetota bacterium]